MNRWLAAVTAGLVLLVPAGTASATTSTTTNALKCDTKFPYKLCVETIAKHGNVNAIRARFNHNWASANIVAHVELSSGTWRFNTVDKVYHLSFLKPLENTEWFYPDLYTPTQVCGTLWQKKGPGNYKRLVTTCTYP